MGIGIETTVNDISEAISTLTRRENKKAVEDLKLLNKNIEGGIDIEQVDSDAVRNDIKQAITLINQNKVTDAMDLLNGLCDELMEYHPLKDEIKECVSAFIDQSCGR